MWHVTFSSLLRGFPLTQIENRFSVYLHVVWCRIFLAFPISASVSNTHTLQSNHFRSVDKWCPRQRNENRVRQIVLIAWDSLFGDSANMTYIGNASLHELFGSDVTEWNPPRRDGSWYLCCRGFITACAWDGVMWYYFHMHSSPLCSGSGCCIKHD